MGRFIGAAVRVDRGVITTLGDALGSDRPLVTPVGMLGMTPGRLATEDDAYDPKSFGGPRDGVESTFRSVRQLGIGGPRAIASSKRPITESGVMPTVRKASSDASASSSPPRAM